MKTTLSVMFFLFWTFLSSAALADKYFDVKIQGEHSKILDDFTEIVLSSNGIPDNNARTKISARGEYRSETTSATVLINEVQKSFRVRVSTEANLAQFLFSKDSTEKKYIEIFLNQVRAKGYEPIPTQ